MSTREIEIAITELPANKVRDLMSWFAEYYSKLLEVQIEYDLETGHLDSILAEANREYEAGLAQIL